MNDMSFEEMQHRLQMVEHIAQDQNEILSSLINDVFADRMPPRLVRKFNSLLAANKRFIQERKDFDDVRKEQFNQTMAAHQPRPWAAPGA